MIVEACVWTKQSNSPDAGKLIRKAVEDGASVNDHDATSYMWTVLSSCRGACVRLCTRRRRIRGESRIPYRDTAYRYRDTAYRHPVSGYCIQVSAGMFVSAVSVKLAD